MARVTRSLLFTIGRSFHSGLARRPSMRNPHYQMVHSATGTAQPSSSIPWQAQSRRRAGKIRCRGRTHARRISRQRRIHSNCANTLTLLPHQRQPISPHPGGISTCGTSILPLHAPLPVKENDSSLRILRGASGQSARGFDWQNRNPLLRMGVACRSSPTPHLDARASDAIYTGCTLSREMERA